MGMQTVELGMFSSDQGSPNIPNSPDNACLQKFGVQERNQPLALRIGLPGPLYPPFLFVEEQKSM